MKRLVVASMLVVGGLALLATGVFAHSRPIRFSPAPGEVLNTAPASVQGWFTSDIRRDPNWSYLHVEDAQGNRVDTGETTLSTDRLQMSVGLRSGLGPGIYTVEWRTWDDADGEIFGDCYVFYVGQAAADAAVTSKTRLDAGRNCERLEFHAGDGTPTPAQVAAQQGAAAAAGGEMDKHSEEDHEGSDGIPLWGLIGGIVGGVVVGGAGARFLGKQS